ncbi:glycosyltransferase family 2 protein [Desulfovibrio sp. X2]|uniref:glycosyltransferase n=1 Tax=Desulfovibrio sp. X2 TaxID=941449 RepID=UPI00055290DF|nr:glycosyltransferase family A protein [Desulfovibrio sp. X2]
MPRLCVVVPNHDYGRFLPRLFAALAAQTLPLSQVRIVFADDGSTDGSADAARALLPGLGAASWEVVELPHGGRPGRTRNEGAARAGAPFAVCLDPDDEPMPDFLASLLAALEAGADVAYADYAEVGADGEERAVRLPDFDPDLLRTQNVLAPTAMFRLESFRAARGYRENTEYEDWDLWTRMALVGCRFARVPRVLYRHIWHGANFSRLAQARDGPAKAHLVRNNKRFFAPEVGQWADALLRGEPWALPFGRGLVPRASDVARMRELAGRAAAEISRRGRKGG